jgi:hypothetical protein
LFVLTNDYFLNSGYQHFRFALVADGLNYIPSNSTFYVCARYPSLSFAISEC